MDGQKRKRLHFADHEVPVVGRPQEELDQGERSDGSKPSVSPVARESASLLEVPRGAHHTEPR